MYKFLAMRIHDGFLTWGAVEAKGNTVYTAVKKAYEEMYGNATGDNPGQE